MAAREMGDTGKGFHEVEAILIEEETIAVPDKDELVDTETDEVELGGGLPEQLERLSDLHACGALSDEKFTAAKAKLLQ